MSHKFSEPEPSKRNRQTSVTEDDTVPTAAATRPVNANDYRGLELYIGTVLRQTRVAKDLNIADVAQLAGLSRGMVSKIENGQVTASLDSLARLMNALALSFSQLFRDYDSPEASAQLVKGSEGNEVIRSGTKKGYTYHLLSYNRGYQRNFEPFLITMDDESQASPTFQHEGIQFIYMLQGEMEYRHGKHIYTLEEGDSFTFNARVPHGPERLVQVPVRFVAVTIFDNATRG